MPMALLKMIASCLDKHQAYVTLAAVRSDTFDINLGLPQGSSLNPYLFIGCHCDLIICIGAHSEHLFADGMSVLIGVSIMGSLSQMIGYLGKEGTQVNFKLLEYAKNGSNLLIYKKQ